MQSGAIEFDYTVQKPGFDTNCRNLGLQIAQRKGFKIFMQSSSKPICTVIIEYNKEGETISYQRL